ncbi:alpha/beta fold hydrolase [Luteolibacter ambystomatis]|uniref:Alpha/beta fold hydrolase n=1 Tax=Luteolibacter ambystomatis TaxID=2824561 RepID=A0A975G6W4_9BACT|nr:alpha/beta fold hydrolase [Luteolibacter ambystomatis]QUE49881.1 alpha/beta fold hydrolase [Luteolibacter ambystomatis]
MNLPEFRNRLGERIDTSFHSAPREDVLLVLGHGLTGNKDRPLLIALAEGLSKRGWPCLRISYTGSGGSEGRFEDVTITKETEDLADLLDALPEGVRIAYCGHSMGGAVGVITTAADARIRVLVTLSGMVYTANFVEREFDDIVPGEGVMWEDPDFPLSKVYVADLQAIGDTLDVAAEIEVPWLLIHGSQDDIIPVLDSEDAYAAAQCDKHLVEIDGADHVFDETSYPRIIEEVDAWLKEYL